MIRFRYKAVRPDGELVEGELEAADEAAAIRQLQREGLLPLRTRSSGIFPDRLVTRPTAKPSRREVIHLYFELSSLLAAGLPLDRALQILAGLSEDTAMSRVIRDLEERVRGGIALSEAIARRGEIFSPFQASLVKAGETSGRLGETLERLARYLEESEKLRERIRSALLYPTILVLVAGLSVAGLLMFVVPRFGQMFEEMEQPLPLATRIVVEAGILAQQWWWLLLLLPALFALWIVRSLARPAIRQRWERKLLKWPVVGRLVSHAETARLCRTLAILLESGVPLPKALQLSSAVVGNHAIRSGVEHATKELRKGRGLGAPLAELGLLPPLAVQLIRVGEETGNLPVMLHRLSETMDDQVQAGITRLLALLEPALIVGLALLVAGIITSILMAVLDANQLLL